MPFLVNVDKDSLNTRLYHVVYNIFTNASKQRDCICLNDAESMVWNQFIVIPIRPAASDEQ